MSRPSGRHEAESGRKPWTRSSRRRRQHSLLTFVAALSLAAACGDETDRPARAPAEPAVSADTATRPARSSKLFPSADPIPGRYVVVLDDATQDVPGVAAGLAKAQNGKLGKVYEHALRGFAVELATDADAEALARDKRVRWVEQDGVVHSTGVQLSPSWGLDRIHQRGLPLDAAYVYGATGLGVRVYVIDTGVRVTHQDFEGRATLAFDSVGDGMNGNDCNGHGTHVAANVAGATYGVAKQASIYAVRVLDCGGSGSYSGVIAGVDWVTANKVGPSVANMSLGGPGSPALDEAVRNSILSGVVYAVAAGNSAANACDYSPASTAEAITVGATDSSDAVASFSNQGGCVDVFAPGVGITSAWNTADAATQTLSGTSMATPHVAGTAALILEMAPLLTPAAVETLVTDQATPAILTGLGAGSPSLMLYSGFVAAGPPDSQPPTVRITSPASGAVVKGLQPVAAMASDDVGVTHVSFVVDGVAFGGADAAPFTASWNSALVANGEHVLVARAYDQRGNVGASAPVTVTTANPVTLTVTLVTPGIARGSVSGGTINCSAAGGSGCTAGVDAGTSVTLAATAGADSAFAGWSGACTGTGTCTIRMDVSKTVTATFRATVAQLTVATAGAATGTVLGGAISCTTGSAEGCYARLPLGARLTLTASPGTNAAFAGWSGACTGKAECVLDLSADRSVTARFEPAFNTLTVQLGGDGVGTVSGPGLNCSSANPAGCSATVAFGTTVTLTAVPQGDAFFAGWSACAGTATTCGVLVQGDVTVTARFSAGSYLLTAGLQGQGSGTITGAGLSCSAANPAGCSARVATGASVVLSAAPDASSLFSGWTGCSGTNGTCSFAMTSNRTVAASFAPSTFPLTVVVLGAGKGTVIGNGITCTAGNCYSTVANGGSVSLSAAAAPGSIFKAWGGRCTGTAACAFSMNSASTVTATFEPSTYPLTVTVYGAGRGTVSGPGIACTTGSSTGCATTVANGGTVTMTATPQAGSFFSGWSGACSGTGSCTITAKASTTLNATFLPSNLQLTLSTSGSGRGTVTGPYGLACTTGSTAGCTVSVPYNGSVTLTETPDASSVFAGWTGCSGTGTCTFTMTAPRSVTASFAPSTYQLTVVVLGAGKGTVSGNGITCSAGNCYATVASGGRVTLGAAASTGSIFKAWGGRCSGTGACDFTMNSATTVTATFEPATYPLNVTLYGAGRGTVSGPGVSCTTGSSSGCAGTVANGGTVTLTATPQPGSFFSAWSGACQGATPTCTVTAKSAVNVSATFLPSTLQLTVSTSGSGRGAVTGPYGLACTTGSTAGCTVSVPYNGQVTLTETPDASSLFAGWTGCSGTGTCTFTMTAPRSVTASFAPSTYQLTVVVLGAGKGTVSGNGITCTAGNCYATVASGGRVTLSAAPGASSIFKTWGGRCTGTGACDFSMNSATTVTATFEPSTYPLSVTLYGAGRGTVSGPGVSCTSGSSTGCATTVANGGTVTLAATPQSGSSFSAWSGACQGSATTCTVTAKSAVNVNATFLLTTSLAATAGP